MARLKKFGPSKKSTARGPKLHLKIDQSAAKKFEIKQPDSPSARFLSPNEAGRLLGLTGPGIKRWIRTGKLRASKGSNGYWWIDAKDLEVTVRRRSEIPPKRVLLFASEARMREQLAAVMETPGMDTVACGNITDATLKLHHHRPNALVVVSDEDGWKLIAKARQSSHLRGSTIILIAERDLSDADSDRALELGIQGFLRLPAEDGAIAQRVRELVSRTA